MPEYFNGHDFISGKDLGGRPVMISRFGSMDIDKVFGDVEAFVRYRAKLMENAISMLTFKKGEAECLTQVHDYSGVIGSMYKENVKAGVTAVSNVFSEHYPEFKGKTMFVNFPAIFSGPFKAFALLLPERTRNKFVVLGKDDHLALFEHIDPGLIPTSLGGLLRSPLGKLTGPGKAIRVTARAVEDVTMLKIDKAAKVAWDVCVCTAEVAFDIVFKPEEGSEEVLQSRGPSSAPTIGGYANVAVGEAVDNKQYLQAIEGVVGGEYEAKLAGEFLCRFKNENAWFKGCVCCC